MGRNPHEATAQAGGKKGYSGGTHGASGDSRSGGDAPHLRTQTTFTPKKKTVTRDGITRDGIKTAATIYSALKHPVVAAAKFIGQKVFQPKTEQQKVQANIDKGHDVLNPAEMHRATQPRIYTGPEGRGADEFQNNIASRSLVTAPTADKAAGFGHQWDFKAYGANTNVAGNPYDYTQAPYAKKGKMIRKYGTGQEIKNFSKGKRFGPPPLKGPDPQGLQVILENSDYFKKLIG
jgi:hypothetical protein